MERCQGQLEAEMQTLEEEKNRVIEEAFIRAESEMKAVHQNLAGVRMNLLTLQPALRTLTCDYNCLKRQVQDFPFMLEKAIAEAKQEVGWGCGVQRTKGALWWLESRSAFMCARRSVM